MKRSMYLVPCALLVAIGCQGNVPTATDSPTASQNATENVDGTAITFVSLKVPNMT